MNFDVPADWSRMNSKLLQLSFNYPRRFNIVDDDYEYQPGDCKPRNWLRFEARRGTNSSVLFVDNNNGRDKGLKDLVSSLSSSGTEHLNRILIFQELRIEG